MLLKDTDNLFLVRRAFFIFVRPLVSRTLVTDGGKARGRSTGAGHRFPEHGTADLVAPGRRFGYGAGMDTEFDIFLICPPGLEPLLAEEAQEAGFAPVASPGGVTLGAGFIHSREMD